MEKIGEVIQLFVSQQGKSDRISQPQIQLDSHGIVGDKFYGKNPKRSVLLTSKASYELAKAHQIALNFGQLGENILIDYNPYLLPLKTQLQIGEVIVEITQNCTICNHLAAIDNALPKLLATDRGIFVHVIQGGIIHRHDALYRL